MTSEADHAPHRWRRLLRFSVQGLIVFVLVIVAALGGIVRQARVQRDAVAAIEREGGGVIYDSGWSDGPTLASREPWVPRWLVNTLGIDYFSHVSQVWLVPASTDIELAQVGRLARLRGLSLKDCMVTDAGLVHLKELTNLSRLDLCGTHVTDAGLVQLKGLTNLSRLVLDGTQVTDAGLLHFKGLTNLSILRLRGTQVTDAGLIRLKGLTKLTMLVLDRTRVTDAGARALNQALPSLRIIR
jgi:Leucine-rich repeat (LRR) protein